MKSKLIILFAIIVITILIFIIRNAQINNNLNGFEKIILSNPEIKSAPDCKIVDYCGDTATVNCRAEVDGPFFYVNKYSGEILEYCGGYCLMPLESREGKYCQNCPPKDWNC